MLTMKLMNQDKKHQRNKSQKHNQTNPGTFLNLSFMDRLDNDSILFQFIFL